MAHPETRVTIEMAASLDREPMRPRIALHLAEVKAYKSGMVELRYEVRPS